MQGGSGTKNPPWARSNVNTNITGMNPQIMDPSSVMSQQGMMPYQQSQSVYNANMMQAQGGMAMPMGGQMPMNQMAQGQMYPGNVVAYPTPRAMNPGMYQNNQSNQSQSTEQRVFTGTVTKTHNDFGFVDHDVFYQTSVCAKGVIPKVNDRVLVEASYNPNMPFKWNATRVQVLPKSGTNNPKQNGPKSNNYNAVPPPVNARKSLPRRDERPPRREERKRSRSRSRSPKDRRDSRNRRDSPPRKRQSVHQPSPAAKYLVRVPRIPLDIQKLDVPALSQRYNNMYVPSDFFNAHVKWGETFPPQMPFSLNSPCSFHIMHRDLENPMSNDAILEPADADYRFSAKVMLISMPTLESLYQSCGLTKSDDKDKRNKAPLHPTRLIKFLVGQKGKGGENFAIGGPWSPSLDGENPESDPGVLVKTAIRTCKALTGIDLSSCTQWYRMVEFYYWREGSGGKSRLETVVLFLPDVWSAQPSRIEWTTIQDQYKAACEAALNKLDEPQQPATAVQATTEAPQAAPEPTGADNSAAAAASAADKSQIDTPVQDTTITIDENDDDDDKPEPTHYSKIDLKTIKVDALRQELRARNVSSKGLRAQLVSRLSKLIKTEEQQDTKSEDIMELDDEEQESENKDKDNETETNNDGDNKDVKEENKEIDEPKEKEQKVEIKEKSEKEIEEEKKKIEKEKHHIKSRYELPSTPHIVVHPNAAAKQGKFNCTTGTLSLLLDYRVTDNKEHSFEIFVFAELFNEMLMRDFGFYIYKTLYTLPEKIDEVKEVKEKEAKEKEANVDVAKDEKKEADKKEEKKEGDKKEEKKESDKKEDKKEGDKKDDKKEGDKKEDKKDEKDKRDDRRDSRRKDRKDSHSDDDRSNSPKRRSRGVELPPDPYLLLSLVYFDTTRVGHIIKKDLQNLFMSLGLQLSRSQIRSILEKVCVKDTFNYKSLTKAIKDLASGSSEVMQDLPLDSTVVSHEVPTHIAELEATIASGNRELLPLFNRPSSESTGSSDTVDVSESRMVVYKSRVIDVAALVAAEARSSSQRTKLEEALESCRHALKEARAAAAHTQQAQRGAQTQLSDVCANLNAARARITSLTASSKIFHSALKSIQAKVEAVVNIKYEDDDVVEVVNGPNKDEKNLKGEKEVKVTEKEAVTNDSKEDIKEVKETTDIIATENMDLDDKE